MGKKRTVQPIREMSTVLDIIDYLQIKNERDSTLFTFGIYTGFRISDILKLKVRDARNFIEDDCVYIIEKKTKKEREIQLNPALRKVLNEYIKDKKDYQYLFESRKTTDNVHKPISREHFGRILKEAGRNFGMKRVNTHTMRKTFGYFLYKETGDIVQVMEALNQSDISITKRYIGLTEKQVNDSIVSLNFERQRSQKKRK